MTILTVAVVGAGVMGTSWAIVYARAGLNVAVYDEDSVIRSTLIERVTAALTVSAGLLREQDTVEAVCTRIRTATTLQDAVSEVDYVHECIAETIDAKRAIFQALEQATRARTVLASSTSSFPVSTFAADLPGRERCLVAHPATPPHLLPVTEICPAPFTSDEVTRATFNLMHHCGQVPILIRKEVPSFVLNRLQGALLVEMFRCLQDDLISPSDMDQIISQGFGLRWAFLGPLEAIDLNARGGIREYLSRFGFIFENLAKEYGVSGPLITPEMVDRLEAYVRSKTPEDLIGDRIRLRDDSIARLRTQRAL